MGKFLNSISVVSFMEGKRVFWNTYVIYSFTVYALTDKFVFITIQCKWRVPGQEVDQRKLGDRLWKKTVEHVD